MEYYNEAFLRQLNPLLRIQVDSEQVRQSEACSSIISQCERYDIGQLVWDNCLIRNRISTAKYIIQVKTNMDLDIKAVDVPTIEKIPNKHSILSPFNAKSPIFPNGILTHDWLKKYQEIYPFAMLYVCQLDQENDAGSDSKNTGNEKHKYNDDDDEYKNNDDDNVEDNDDDDIHDKEDDAIIDKLKYLKLKLEDIDCKLVLLVLTRGELSLERQNKIKTELNLAKHGALYTFNTLIDGLQNESEVIVLAMMKNLTKLAHDYYANIEYKIKQRYKKYYSCPPIDDIDTSIELTPKFLETRNLIKQGFILEFLYPRNLETSVKILEVAYQELVEILDTTYAINLLDHDNKILEQFMTLLDVIAFHIVRAYFSIEEPIKALKKHKTHIVNVVEVVKRDHDWVSRQYEWLAQLMRLVPYSIITNLNTTAILKQQLENRRNARPQSSAASSAAASSSSSSVSLLAFFGGIRTPEFDLVTNPGLVYVKAYELSSDPQKRIALLTNAIELLETQLLNATYKNLISGKDKLDALISYINWRIAEELIQMKQYQKASDFLEMAYSLICDSNWFSINHLLLEKLLFCYKNIGDKKMEINTILKLATMPHPTQTQISTSFVDPTLSETKNVFEFATDSKLLEVDLLDSKLHEFFKVDALLINKNLSLKETHVLDQVMFQLTLKSKINLHVLKSFLPKESKVHICVNQIDVSFSRADGRSKFPGIKNISITNDEKKKFETVMQLHGQQLDRTFVDSANLQLSGQNGDSDDSGTGVGVGASGGHGHVRSKLVLQHVQSVHSTSQVQVEVVKLQISVFVKHHDKCIKLNKIELHQTFPISSHLGRLFNFDGTSRPIRLYEPSHIITVVPKKPDIKIGLKQKLDYYILGEKLQIPINIKFDDKEMRATCAKANLFARVRSGDVTLTWEGLKDDEPLNLLTLESGADEVEHLLTVHARFWRETEMKLEIELVTAEEFDAEETIEDNGQGQTTVYPVLCQLIRVLPAPFSLNELIEPVLFEPRALSKEDEGRVNENELEVSTTNDTEGVIRKNDDDEQGAKEDEEKDEKERKDEKDEKENKENAIRLSLLNRVWKLSPKIVDEYKLVNGNDGTRLDIVEMDCNIISQNPEISIEVQKPSHQSYNRTFVTRSRNRLTYRSVLVAVTYNIKWKRSGNADSVDNGINEFNSREKVMSLPLMLPRILLNTEFTLNETDGTVTVELKYVLENPTRAPLNFLTELIDYEDTWTIVEGQVKVGDLENGKVLTVGSVSRNVAEFKLKSKRPILKETGLIRLPNYKVFDVNYKVLLVTMKTQENVKFNPRDKCLYLSVF
ncbi:hypothetical protein LELG_05107 [Lodderomyces elongisporus NRRL YB-4239]|uniref:Trafficking protein particle complex subunit 11 domain-containing protein n=1 Tax=Lodderomyces elongisporus (strain ATCC 11503 / CBS 2605 / JCM 1781 / NBRC 1676 / NRRL YB-4239) TaxID=379508 RepID=A5E668_LODEL|nr:hypothetical protein LELG_05107 [Lodderomyces elongisporus NRRL YB-4239]